MLFINAAISKGVELQNCQQSESFPVGTVTVKNDLLFPVPMSKAILKTESFI